MEDNKGEREGKSERELPGKVRVRKVTRKEIKSYSSVH